MQEDKVERKHQFIAHLRERDKRAQSLGDHLNQVSDLAGQFAGKIGLEQSGKSLGLLHDLGKASTKFQNYILSANGMKDPDADDYMDPVAQKGKVDHSSAGAQVIYEKLKRQGPIRAHSFRDCGHVFISAARTSGRSASVRCLGFD